MYIVSTVSDAIIRISLWSTATRSCSVGYFSSIAANSLLLTWQTVHVVGSSLGGSWP